MRIESLSVKYGYPFFYDFHLVGCNIHQFVLILPTVCVQGLLWTVVRSAVRQKKPARRLAQDHQGGVSTTHPWRLTLAR
ncbi:hypothetical protein BZG20_07365 [Salinivibrio sp. IB868]|nr:hypothetical protein BZG20_07365 [Salinivibrio sp. IB868]OOE77202.1 hypothetical protein BZG22_01680 [Salinivibrio sp. IB870]